jgi:Adenosine deaminase
MTSPAAASSLLATVLGEIDLLGSEYLLDFGEVREFGDRDARWWTDLVAHRYPDVVHPAIEAEMEGLLVACNQDLLTLLMTTAIQRNGDSQAALRASRFPLAMMAQETSEDMSCLDGCEVADSHLHSGGSMPIGILLAGMATRIAPIEEVAPPPRRPPAKDDDPRREGKPKDKGGLSFSSSRGQSWDALVLLAACRWALRLLWYVYDGNLLSDGRQLGQRRLKAELVRSVEEETFWTDVAELATRSPRNETKLAAINCSFPDNGSCPKLADLIQRWRQKQPLGPGSDRFLIGLVRALTALAALASAVPGEGLSRFGDRFRLMSRAQRAAFGGPSLTAWKTKFMVDTIKRVAPTSQVVGAEFRRSFKSSTCTLFRQEVRHELAVHHAAFVAYTKDKESLELTMPVGFSRHTDPDGNPAAAGLNELKHVLAGTEALKLISEEPNGEQLLEAIFSTDVAGVEIGSSNWPFVVGAELLAEAGLDLCFTIHAGESFVSELNGVRRVGELFMGSRAPSRIGHALALSEATTEAVLDRGRPPVVKAEAVMDLAWLYSATGSTAAYRLLAKLVSPSDPETEISATAWIEAFEKLHSIEAVRRLLIAEAGGAPAPRGMEDLIGEARHAGQVERAVAALAWAAPEEIVGVDVSARLSRGETAEYEVLSAAEAPAARKHVLDLMRDHNVVIESCPTSNVTLAGLSSYQEHPIWEWGSQLEPPEITLSSDDPLHFGNSVIAEIDAMLSTGQDPAPVERAVASGLTRCCGGTSNRRGAGWQGYKKVVGLIDDPQVQI